MEKPLQEFLEERGLKLVEKVSKGYSSEIFLVKGAEGKELALKMEKQKSPRVEMAEREAENLKLANSLGIGPKLESFDLKKRIILMEFVKGKTFAEWLFSNPSKKELKGFIEELLEQAGKLDAAGLSHGQLAGKGKNILVREGKPVIVDFEKASRNRKCRNVTQLEAMLFRNPHSATTKKVKEILQG